MREKNFFRYLFYVFSVLLLFGSLHVNAETENKTAEPAGEEDALIAVGKGLAITQKDVREVVAFFEKGTYRLPEKTYRKNAVMLSLFALEAMELGLDRAEGEGKMELDSGFEGKFHLGTLYTEKLMNEYPVSDLVLESFYLSKPDIYGKFDNERQRYAMPPMREEVRREIREKVVTSRKMAIQDKAYDDLIKKYQVRFCDEVGGCK